MYENFTVRRGPATTAGIADYGRSPISDSLPGAIGGAAMLGGGCIGLMAIALPWASIDLVFTRRGFSLPQLWLAAGEFGQAQSALFHLGLTAGLAVGGLTALAAAVARLTMRGTWATVAGWSGLSAGLLMLCTAGMFLMELALAIDVARPSIGVAASIAGGLLTVAGAVTVLAGPLVQRDLSAIRHTNRAFDL